MFQCFVEWFSTICFRNFNKNRALEQWIAKKSPSYGSQSKLLAIDLDNTYGNRRAHKRLLFIIYI